MTSISGGKIIVDQDANLGDPSAGFEFLGLDARLHVTGSYATSRLFTGARKELEIDAGQNLTIDSVITGTFGLDKFGDGVLTLTGANDYSGTTIVQSGTLLANNTTGSATGLTGVNVASGATLGGDGHIAGGAAIQNGATLTPGNSPGVISFGSTLGFGSLATLNIEIAGTSPTGPVQFDQVHVAGAATLRGTLDVDLLNGFVPTQGDEFIVITAGTRNGEFDQYEDLFVTPGLTLAPVYDHDGNIGLTLIAAKPGDANFDGVVDVADLGILGANFGDIDTEWITADFNLDSTTDVADLGVLGANWSAGQSLTFDQALRVTGLSALVPEPGTAALWAAVWITALGRCRR